MDTAIAAGEAQAAPIRHAESDPPQIIIVIPVYNHSGTLRDVVTKSLKVHDRVMVVDDGSTDGGVDTLEGLEVDIVRHPRTLERVRPSCQRQKRP